MVYTINLWNGFWSTAFVVQVDECSHLPVFKEAVSGGGAVHGGV